MPDDSAGQDDATYPFFKTTITTCNPSPQNNIYAQKK
jgi:hypothetical protein